MVVVVVVMEEEELLLVEESTSGCSNLINEDVADDDVDDQSVEAGAETLLVLPLNLPSSLATRTSPYLVGVPNPLALGRK